MDTAGSHAHQVAFMRVEFVLDLELGEIATATVIDSVVANVMFDTLDTGDHCPGTVIVRRSPPARQSAQHQHGQRMIRLPWGGHRHGPRRCA